MSNYTKATNFTIKDGLASGNSAKLIKGTELDVEFSAIAVAIATKPEATSATLTTPTLASPVLTGTMSGSGIIDGGTY